MRMTMSTKQADDDMDGDPLEIVEPFDAICLRPSMYAGNGSFQSVAVFLTGYLWAIETNGLVADSIAERLGVGASISLNDWVAYRLGYESVGPRGWQFMIADRTKSDREAIDLLQSLTREFVDRQMRLVGRVRATGCMSAQVSPSYPMPDAAGLYVATDDRGFFAVPETPQPWPLHSRFFSSLDRFFGETGYPRDALSVIDAAALDAS